MRICFISNDYPTELNYGGVGTYVYETAHYLSEHGHDVHVITVGRKDKDYNDGKVHIHAVLPRFFWLEDYQLRRSFNIKSLPRDISKFFIELTHIDAAMLNSYISKRICEKFLELDDKLHFDIVEADDGGGIALDVSKLDVRLITRLHSSWYLVSVINKDFRKIDFINKYLLYLLHKLRRILL